MDLSDSAMMVGERVWLPTGKYNSAIQVTYDYEEEYTSFEYIGLAIDPKDGSSPDSWAYITPGTEFTLTEATEIALIAIRSSNPVFSAPIAYVKVMVVQSGKSTDFKPYFPPYLEDTKVTEIINHGANLLDTSKYTNTGAWAFNVESAEGYLKLTAKTNIPEKGTYVRAECPIVIPEGSTRLYLKGTINISNTTNRVLSIYYYDQNDVLIKEVAVFQVNNASGTLDFANYSSIPNGASKAKICYYGIANNTTLKGDYVEWSNLIVSTIDVPYIPYREPIHYPIPEAIQAQMSGKGILDTKNNAKYLDTVNFDSGKCEYKMNTLILNGTEIWKSENRNSGKKDLNFYMDNPIGKPLTYVVCNYFESYWGGSTGIDNNIWISGTGKLNCTAVGFYSVDEWKAHLAKLYAGGNPVTVTYARVDPTEEALAATMDTIFSVKPGEYLEFVNKSNSALPSTIDVAMGRIAHLELEHKDIINNMVTQEDL
jgi:hypothetical protein